MTGKTNVAIDSELKLRLSALAERRGTSVSELAEGVLRHHADEAERGNDERAEDEARWQQYLETGKAVSFDRIREKLQQLAAEAALKSAQ